MTFEKLVADARRIAEPAAETMAAILPAVEADLMPLPTTPPPGGSFGFVDGAVVSNQSDALAWIAAVAVAESPFPPVRVTDEQALPVSTDVEAFRGMLMALCEVTAAGQCPANVVALDGGMVTSLLSLAGHASLREPATKASAVARLSTPEAVQAVTRFVDRLVGGEFIALPKQDTATAYCRQWRAAAAVKVPDGALEHLRDRPLAQLAMPPGTMLIPRPAIEARRIKADSDSGVGWLDGQLSRIRGCGGLHVTYVKPARGAQRAIKIEFVETDTATWETGRQLAAAVASMCVAPRILEPAGQHLVDRECKRFVTAHYGRVEQAIAEALPSDAARHYRT